MKIALLGKGKTGSKVLEHSKFECVVFDSKNPPTQSNLVGCDVVISFLPGEAFLSYLPMLLETKKPVVIGSTGMILPANLNEQLKSQNLTWIYATNFSLGVAVVRELLLKLSSFAKLFPQHHSSIHEIHHIHKKDAPSGTALSFEKWIGEKCQITSSREGDVIGFHELTFDTGSEKIKISHEALDRKLFAEGAIWAAEYLNKNSNPGLHEFQKILGNTL